jgi:transcription antitermination factor NusG
VRTHSQAERWAHANLTQLGYRAYLPMAKVRRQDRVVKSLWHDVAVPMFSGYLFVQHDPATSWGPIRDAPGVRNVIRCGSQIQYARAGAVEALQAVEALGAAALPLRRKWAPGVPCRLVAGAFEGHEGVVLQVGREMVLISLLVFGALREVLVQADSLAVREG